MCGIFGIVAQKNAISRKNFINLGLLSERRGKDSSGLFYITRDGYRCSRADIRFSELINRESLDYCTFAIGHSRLITNGQSDNQPVVRNGLAVIHNGIITNDKQYWAKSDQNRLFSVDTEAILGVATKLLADNKDITELYSEVRSTLRGSFSCALVIPREGKLILMSNTGSLYIGRRSEDIYFASERFFLETAGCIDIKQLIGQEVYDVPLSNSDILVYDYKVPRPDLIPTLGSRAQEEKKLIFPEPRLKRCMKCILPESMPFISFDSLGVCNYCNNYSLRNKPKPREILDDLFSRYRSQGVIKCIMPFSGGRDSSFALHLLTKEFGIRPITMTYDWGMVTDLARRNISRMCGELNIENILIADDISKKRQNIKTNLQAWLRAPDLGMINILMAGDKHFFRHIEAIKRETNIKLNVWGHNPLEVTHFKAGFLGFPPNFATKQVFYTGLTSQLQYQKLRAKAMIRNPSYLNRTLWDTLSGEYYRSVKKKTDYYDLFDYWHWDEAEINKSIESYGWEKAPDTNSTWRIGDGTAAFYNYVYYTMAGFTENDTFRSNQIREGQISRELALELVAEENRPRYQNIKWYLDAVGMEFESVIHVINNAKRAY
jgi:glucosamine--fructose-6-phosphate aminotransferase (isomerizing)